MIPIPLLLALFLGFALDVPSTPPDEVGRSLTRIVAAIGAVTSAAFVVGLGTAWRVRRRGFASSRTRRGFNRGARLVTLASLVAYGLIIHVWGWPGLVLSTWNWRGSILVDDALLLAPFLIMQLLGWWGTFYGERAVLGLPADHVGTRTARHLYLRERQSFGLVLPIILLFIVRNDLINRLWPSWSGEPWGEAVELAASGALILAASPLFLRLAWPTRRLPDGPLRRRLESVARRSGFRYSDVLIWDTDHMMANACVTGVLPRFRYILLSDALIDGLTPAEIAAVFGHEVGHVAHRHLTYFLFFFVGLLCLLSLGSEAFAGLEEWTIGLTTLDPTSPALFRDAVEGLVIVLIVGTAFWVVFGALSRRFERQADVYGCKSVSCESPDCPPHIDLDDQPGGDDRPIRTFCPMGIRIFADALAAVARLNGIPPGARSWRHGSIGSRIEFLSRLAEAPGREPVFQSEVRRLRVGLAVLLLSALSVAVAATWAEWF